MLDFEIYKRYQQTYLKDMRIPRVTRIAGVGASIAAHATLRLSVKAPALAVALCAVLFGAGLCVVSMPAAAAGEPVDITFSTPGPFAGGPLTYHVTGMAFSGDHSFAAGFDLGGGLLPPRGRTRIV